MTSILLVDDDTALRAALCEGLTGEGYVIREAGNGREALDSLEADPVDIVLTDLSMPDMDGLELISRLQKDYARQFRIIAMTAGLKPDSAEDDNFVLLRAADAMGAIRTIEKPFRLEALLNLLRVADKS